MYVSSTFASVEISFLDVWQQIAIFRGSLRNLSVSPAPNGGGVEAQSAGAFRCQA
jgi:hypothetical protein